MQSDHLTERGNIMIKAVTKTTAVEAVSNGKTASPPVAKKGGVNTITKRVVRDDNDHATGVAFEFSNGKRFTLSLADVNSDITADLACHGIAQKIGDAAAKSQGASVDDKYDACSAVFERLKAGEWAAKREGAGEGVTGGLLAKAIAEVTGKPIEGVREFLKARSAEE